MDCSFLDGSSSQRALNPDGNMGNHDLTENELRTPIRLVLDMFLLEISGTLRFHMASCDISEVPLATIKSGNGPTGIAIPGELALL